MANLLYAFWYVSSTWLAHVAKLRGAYAARNNWSFQHPELQAVPAAGSPGTTVDHLYRVETTNKSYLQMQTVHSLAHPTVEAYCLAITSLKQKLAGLVKTCEDSLKVQEYLSTCGCFHIGKDPLRAVSW